MIELGWLCFCPPLQGGAIAAESEQLGFDIQLFGDNQCFTSDPFSELRAAAETTSTIKLATGVTNLMTRRAAVVASAIATVHLASDGRAICGVGKGDSAVATLGLKPQRNVEFSQQLQQLRAYLQGETVINNGVPSRLDWVQAASCNPVPIEVMAAGPKSLFVAGGVADRISLGVGADRGRVEWALEHVDRGLEAAGRTRADVEIGTFLHVAFDEDSGQAAERLRAKMTSWAHMQSFPGTDLSSQPKVLREVTEQVRDAYDYSRHHNSNSSNELATAISLEFAEWFGLCGSTDRVIDGIGALVESGLNHFYFINVLAAGGKTSDRMPERDRDLLIGEVMPAIRDMA